MCVTFWYLYLFSRGGSNPHHCGQRAQTPPMSYSGPLERHSRNKIIIIIIPDPPWNDPSALVSLHRVLQSPLQTRTGEQHGANMSSLYSCNMSVHSSQDSFSFNPLEFFLAGSGRLYLTSPSSLSLFPLSLFMENTLYSCWTYYPFP